MMLTEFARLYRQDKMIVDLFELREFLNLNKYIYKNLGEHFPYLELEEKSYTSSFVELAEELKKLKAMSENSINVNKYLKKLKQIKF